jgi:hypothetical protein
VVELRPENGISEPAETGSRVAHPFEGVRSRRSVDEMLKGMQEALIAYTAQADTKASMVITTSSLVLTICATRWSEHSLRPMLAGVAIGSLCALVAAITVVMPKFRMHRRGEVRPDLAPADNPLFFGHFAALPRERFIEIVGSLAHDDVTMYEAQCADIHDQGVYLIEKKYRHLRVSYVFLALAFVAGAVAQAISVAV